VHLFHIVAARDWQAACELGSYAPGSLAAQGFVHFSFAHQVEATANRFYAEQDDLIVIEVDPTRLGAAVVLEDLAGEGQDFPHVYAPIPVSAVLGHSELRRGPDGSYAFDPPAV
jgi:uncharacterized protein (DUF952 family)